MELVEVKSSNIRAIGYDGGTLAVQFAKGDIFHYANVPGEEYEALLNAKSIGAHFAARIRGKYEGKKVTE